MNVHEVNKLCMRLSLTSMVVNEFSWISIKKKLCFNLMDHFVWAAMDSHINAAFKVLKSANHLVSVWAYLFWDGSFAH